MELEDLQRKQVKQHETGHKSQGVPGKAGASAHEMDTRAEDLDGFTNQGNIRIQSSCGEDSLTNTLDAKDTLNRVTNCGNNTKNT